MQGARPAVRLVLSRCSGLLLWALALWLVLLYPAFALGGSDGVEGLTLAAVLCLLPGWLVLAIGSRWGTDSSQAPLLVIGGSVLRMLFVLGGMLVVQGVREDLQFHEFVLWLLVFYLGMLAVETRLLLRTTAEGQRVKQESR